MRRSTCQRDGEIFDKDCTLIRNFARTFFSGNCPDKLQQSRFTIQDLSQIVCSEGVFAYVYLAYTCTCYHVCLRKQLTQVDKLLRHRVSSLHWIKRYSSVKKKKVHKAPHEAHGVTKKKHSTFPRSQWSAALARDTSRYSVASMPSRNGEIGLCGPTFNLRTFRHET